MLILGIETSCDETAAAVVKDGRTMLSNVISSQIDLHQKTGGIVPEVAAREHTVRIIPVIQSALEKAGNLRLNQLDAIACTLGPGLLSSLLTGVNTAMTLAAVVEVPLIPVHHIEGHIYANWIGSGSPPKFPAAVLTASGGHNELLLWNGHGSYTFLGATLDDAAGEAFDKVARLLGLSYPGGPAIQHAAKTGNPNRYALPRVFLDPWHVKKNRLNFNFSFSGLKTAVLYLLKGKRKTERLVCDVAACFQDAVCEVLAHKLAEACLLYKAREAHLAGGVSANKRLRELSAKFLPQKTPLRFCSDLKLCTDNAAMIAAAGYYRYKKNPEKYQKWPIPKPDPNLKMQAW